MMDLTEWLQLPSGSVKMVAHKEREGTITEVIDQIEIRRHPGKRIDVPDTLTLGEAAKVLQRQADEEEEVVKIIEQVRCFPYDGALALQSVLEEMYGVIFAEVIPSFWGDQPPKEISVEVAYNETVNVKWGRFRLPGTTNKEKDFIETAATVEKGLPTFNIVATVRRKFERTVRDIADRVRKHVAAHSIYRFQAFRMLFSNNQMDPMPQIRFLDLTHTNPQEMVFPTDLTHLIAVNLWTPILHTEIVSQARVPRKRGILLTGPYGTGKTLLAYVTAGIAKTNHWTFIYIENVAQLPQAIQWAKQFGRVVIFAEDIDKASEDVNSTIPNTLDGLDTKDSEIMVVLTTNHLDKVNQMLLRPGRLDCVLPILPPDAEAHTRLIQVYGRGMLEPDEDFMPVGEILAGQNVIPAVTREVVDRAKLAFITRAPEDAKAGKWHLNANDLLWSAKTMEAQLELLQPVKERELTPAEQFGREAGREQAKGLNKALREMGVLG